MRKLLHNKWHANLTMRISGLHKSERERYIVDSQMSHFIYHSFHALTQFVHNLLQVQLRQINTNRTFTGIPPKYKLRRQKQLYEQNEVPRSYFVCLPCAGELKELLWLWKYPDKKLSKLFSINKLCTHVSDVLRIGHRHLIWNENETKNSWRSQRCQRAIHWRLCVHIEENTKSQRC